MRGNNVLGILFSNMHDDEIRELTAGRATGSVPFGGRYRLIDFPLSNMTNSGITKVGIITKNNYRSLMDHVGSGKAWDLSRKREGIILLPPYRSGAGMYESRLGALVGIRDFLLGSREEYVLLSDCDTVCNIDFGKVLDYHNSTGADITMLYQQGRQEPFGTEFAVLSVSDEGRITQIIHKKQPEEKSKYYINMCIMRRSFLLERLEEASAYSLKSFSRDILQTNVFRFRIMGYPVEGYCGVINSVNDYFRVNMDLLQKNVRQELFRPQRPIYTKVKDTMPTRFGLDSEVKNSLIADGCVIEGKVTNCILFRGVHVAAGAEISDSIIMQGSQIGKGSHLNYVILDKNVIIREDRSMVGFATYPVFIRKDSII